MMLGGMYWTIHGVERLKERCGLTPHEFVDRTDPRTLRAVIPGAEDLSVGSLNARLVFEWEHGLAHVITVIPLREGVKKKRPRFRECADD